MNISSGEDTGDKGTFTTLLSGNIS
jgi:hypothetical protein